MTTKAEQQGIVRASCEAFRSLPWSSISMQTAQIASNKDRPAKGGLWISRTEFPAPPESDLRDHLYQVIDQLSSPEHIVTPASATALQPVRVEFLGARQGVAKDAPEPDISENEKLEALQQECQDDMTLLFVHGGGMCFSSPPGYRGMSARLAKLTKARVASIGHRLSPQNTFPAPLLDLLVAYTSLLHPPEGAAYTAVPAQKLVLAGSSSGAALIFALIKFLIEYRKLSSHGLAMRFHRKSIPILPLPAGVATISGWGDACDSMPSWHTNGPYDFLSVHHMSCMPGYPTDAIWPTSPPREHPYCRGMTLDHELVCAAAVKDWTGAPPMWFTLGCEERGLDGNKVVASQMAKSGVQVEWHEYEGMTHEFVTMTSMLPQSKLALERWAKACRAFVDGKPQASATRFLMPGSKAIDIGPVKNLSPLPHDAARERMREYKSTWLIWTGGLEKSRL